MEIKTFTVVVGQLVCGNQAVDEKGQENVQFSVLPEERRQNKKRIQGDI
jgi:hypothetical protein